MSASRCTGTTTCRRCGWFPRAASGGHRRRLAPKAQVERGAEGVGEEQPNLEIGRPSGDACEQVGEQPPFHRLGDALDSEGIRRANPGGRAIPNRPAVVQLPPLREQDTLRRAKRECLLQADDAFGLKLDASLACDRERLLHSELNHGPGFRISGGVGKEIGRFDDPFCPAEREAVELRAQRSSEVELG